jgi:nucleoid-associated protein YgaU
MATKSSKTETKTDKYGSTILGFIVVLVLGIFLFNVFRGNGDKTGQVDVGDTGSNTQTTDEGWQDGQKRYAVNAGDTLWDISVQEYGTGYNWQDIADANSLPNPDLVEEGTQLIIPKVTPIGSIQEVAGSATEQPLSTPVGATVDELPSDVTVQQGDSLWSISTIVYGNGYQWSRIADANNIANPNVIHPGTVLIIPQ